MRKLILILAMLFVVSSAQASIYKYDCKCIKDDHGCSETGKVELNLDNVTLKGKIVFFSDVDPNEVDGADLIKYDPKYKPRYNTDSYRFLVTKTGYGTEYINDYIIQKNLLKGAARGYFKYQARGEGYFSGTFACRRTK